MTGGYDAGFYDGLGATALPSAEVVVPMVLDLTAAGSVVDVGCGDGSWLSVFRAHGVSRVLGIDGYWVAEQQLRIPADAFRRRHLEEEIAVGERFDLAMTLEVAEHLPPGRAAGFVADLCALAPLVLFSAAIPDQGGHRHVNEQWPAYWARLFAAQGYRALDVLRLRVWDDPAVHWWYKQNILLYASDAALAANGRLAGLAGDAPAAPPALVHPEMFEAMVRRARPSFGRWLKSGVPAWRRSLRKRRRAPDPAG